MNQMTDRQGDEMAERLRAMADRWRERLADPVLADQIRTGRATLSPLVKNLLAAFPPNSAK